MAMETQDIIKTLRDQPDNARASRAGLQGRSRQADRCLLLRGL